MRDVPAETARDRPAPVHFDDLGAPVHSAEAQVLLGGLAAYGSVVSLTPEALLAAARQRTGLDEWGDPAFRERLDVVCAAWRTEANLSPAGVAVVFEQTVRLLCNRLLVEGLMARHPEIADVEVARPIIICGLPRTGTTLLHNLLAVDPSLRHLPYWESLEPVPPAAEEGADPDPRLSRAEARVVVIDTLMPEFRRMHEIEVERPHEDIQLLAMDVSGFLFETQALVPSVRDHFRAHDQTPSYAYLKRVLQVLGWLRGNRRWVLKSPQHVEQFGPLVSTFPDATFVVTHRDPVEVTASLCTMAAYGARGATDRPDPLAIGRYWADRTADLLTACERDRHLLPADRSIDLRFDDLMDDELGAVERIYELAGHPLGADARSAMAAYLAEHPRGRHGEVRYDLQALGLDPAERRAALRDYHARFVARSSPSDPR